MASQLSGGEGVDEMCGAANGFGFGVFCVYVYLLAVVIQNVHLYVYMKYNIYTLGTLRRRRTYNRNSIEVMFVDAPRGGAATCVHTLNILVYLYIYIFTCVRVAFIQCTHTLAMSWSRIVLTHTHDCIP